MPHEAWHVVQQKQGRVKPTMQMKGKVNVNDDSGLEREADVMGAKALQMKGMNNNKAQKTQNNKSDVVQGFFGWFKNEEEKPQAKVAKIHIHADVDTEVDEKFGFKHLTSGEVGHAWVSLEWNDPDTISPDIKAAYPKHVAYLKNRRTEGKLADPMGFWPFMYDSYFESSLSASEKDDATDKLDIRRDKLIAELNNETPGSRYYKYLKTKLDTVEIYIQKANNNKDFWIGSEDRVSYKKNPFKSYVKGQVVHPDTLHKPMKTQSYDITEAEAKKVMAYAETKKTAEYSVYLYNCTTFARDAVKAAGKTPPNSSTLGIAYPNKLYESIKSQEAKALKKQKGNSKK